jgi:glycosyltransferase involved in cell wall biosynthesis
MTAMPRAAVFHPELRGGAGSEANAVWFAQAIRGMARVTLVSMGPIDLPGLDGIHGTSLSRGDIETVSLPLPRAPRCRFDALRAYRLGRWAKAHAGEFDLLVSTYNLMDFGKRGLQLIADVSYDDGLRRSLHPPAGGLRSVLYAESPLRSLYLRLGRAIAGQSRDGWRRNLTLANSRWTRDVFESRFKAPCGVLYPPVAADSAPVPWGEKENGFVVLARMAPEKGVERVIAILDEVRRAGCDVHLHILGREDDRRTTGIVRRLCRERADWAHYEGFVTGERKNEFLTRHRYGLSGCRHEAFGIAVAELAAAGAIVWVPRGGGQVEIVGREDLVYDDEQDAARKIARVLGGGERQAELTRHLAARTALFSTARFVEEARAIVRGFLDGESRT